MAVGKEATKHSVALLFTATDVVNSTVDMRVKFT